MARAMVARASTVAHAIEAEVGRAASASAFEHLVSHTLQAQGHSPLPRHNANRLPEVYDPAFLHADTDLAALAQGIATTRSARLCLYGPPGTVEVTFTTIVQEPLAGTVPPVLKVTVGPPAVASLVPVQVPPTAGVAATSTLAGSAGRGLPPG